MCNDKVPKYLRSKLIYKIWSRLTRGTYEYNLKGKVPTFYIVCGKIEVDDFNSTTLSSFTMFAFRNICQYQ